MLLKPLAEEISVTTANTVSDAVLVRVHATASAKITISGASGDRSFTMAANSTEIVPKDTTDTIAANTAVLCVPVAYSI